MNKMIFAQSDNLVLVIRNDSPYIAMFKVQEDDTFIELTENPIKINTEYFYEKRNRKNNKFKLFKPIL